MCNSEFAKMVNFTLNNKIYKREKSFRENIAINKKKILILKMRILYNDLKESIKYLTKAIDEYRELINKTEYYENDICLRFDFNIWNELKKTRGHLTRYLNGLIIIAKYLKGEINDDNNKNCIQNELQSKKDKK